MVKKQVYNSWAFSRNQDEKGQMNREIYQELVGKWKTVQVGRNAEGQYNPDDYDFIYTRESGYNHSVYTVLKDDTLMNLDEMLLVFDQGNLCFGGSQLGGNKFRVSED